MKNFFEWLSNFFSSLFGGSKTQPTPKPVKDKPSVSVIVEDSSDVDSKDVILVKETEIENFEPVGGDPFGDDDKDNAIENSGDNEPSPSTGGGATPATPTTPPKPPDPKPADPSSNPAHKPRFLWLLNNGHGKYQEGKRSPLFADGKTRLFEYKFNRDIVERIMKALDKEGVKYFDVVPNVEEVGQFLEERVAKANKVKSDLPRIYVSVHANAGPALEGKWVEGNIKGVETWFAANSTKGKKIAAVFQKHIVDKTGFRNRNLKSTAEKGLYELVNTAMPAVLTENGFYNHKEEVLELMKDAVRQKIAEAHVAAIMEIEKNGIV